MNERSGERVPNSTLAALLFAGLSIALFHGFNAYAFFAHKNAGAQPPSLTA